MKCVYNNYMKELKKIILAIVSVGGFLLALNLVKLYARNYIMANFIQLDENKFPKSKMNQNGFRFYNIDGKNYPSVTSILYKEKRRIRTMA